MYIGIEMGGTKVLMAVGTGPDDMSAPVRFDTLDPETTLAAILRQLLVFARSHGPIKGIGIASFGPVCVDPENPDYGRILNTPKKGWQRISIIEPIRAVMPDVPIVVDTDVNGAALAEQRWGAAQGLQNFAYVTVGTGIGVGLVIGGKTVHGLLHPEAGHISVKRDPSDSYAGGCDKHGDCLEGLAAGPSVLARTGIRGEDLPVDHPVWTLIGGYVSQLYRSLALVTSVQRIIVGGGVGLHETVLKASRDQLHAGLAGYIDALCERPVMDTYVVCAGLGERAGVLGAIALAA
jgi:fructokinase